MIIQPIDTSTTFGYCHKQKSLYLRKKRQAQYIRNKFKTILERLKQRSKHDYLV